MYISCQLENYTDQYGINFSFSIVDIARVDREYEVYRQQSLYTIKNKRSIFDISFQKRTNIQTVPVGKIKVKQKIDILVIDNSEENLQVNNWKTIFFSLQKIYHVFYQTRYQKRIFQISDKESVFTKLIKNNSFKKLVIIIDTNNLRNNRIPIRRNLFWEIAVAEIINNFGSIKTLLPVSVPENIEINIK